MANAIFLEIIACFLLALILLHRYCDMVNSNIITVVGVFVSWFFSFMVIVLLPADLTTTAYRTCLNISANHIMPTSTPIPAVNLSSYPNSLLINPTTKRAAIPQNWLQQIREANSLDDKLIQKSNLSMPEANPTESTCAKPWSLVPKNALIKVWRFIYWTSQFLTWLLLPIMQSYSKAGDFTPINKLKSALRANLIYYSSFGIIFVVLLTYVIIATGFPTFSYLKVILISSSNTWGLFLLVILLGYGLVELPRFLLNRSRHAKYLNRLYFKVAIINAEKCDAESKIEDVSEELFQVYNVLNTSEHNHLKPYIEKIADNCSPDFQRRFNVIKKQSATSNRQVDQSVYMSYDIDTIIRLNSRVINAFNNHRQIICKWNHIIEEVIEWEDVDRNQNDRNTLTTRTFKSTLPRPKSFINHIYNPTVEWYWKCEIRVWLLRATAYAMACLSLAVFWSEIAFPMWFISPKLSLFALFQDLSQESQRYFLMEMFSIIFIGYLSVCAFYTVFHIKIFNIYYLAPNKMTDEYSLLFSGMTMCRLTAPLCLNYLSLVHRDSNLVEETAFTTIMGHLDLIPFVSRGLNILLPLCISGICFAIYSDIGTQLMHNLGYERYIENDEATIELVNTGRDLVRREKGKLMRNLHLSCYHEMSANRGQDNQRVADSSGDGISGQSFGKSQDVEAIGGLVSSGSSSPAVSRASLLARDIDGCGNRPSFNNEQDTQVHIAPARETVGIDLDLDCDKSQGSSSIESGGVPKKGYFDDV